MGVRERRLMALLRRMSLVSFSQGHGRTDQQQRIIALKPHVADAQTTGVEQVLAIAPLAVNPACLQATRRFLFQCPPSALMRQIG
jgi:hypothetical protein